MTGYSPRTIKVDAMIVVLKELPKENLFIDYRHSLDTAKIYTQDISSKVDRKGFAKKELKLSPPMGLQTLQEETSLLIKIYTKHFTGKKTIKKISVPFMDIWDHLKPKEDDGSSNYFRAAEVTKPQMVLFLDATTNALDAARREILDAKKQLEAMKSVLDRLSDDAKDALVLLQEFLDIVSHFHPLATTVVRYIKLIFNKFKDQDQIHKQMLELSTNMEKMAQYISQRLKDFPDPEPLIESLKKTMINFPNLMIEVAEFIHHWLTNSPGRFLFSSSTLEKVKIFNNRLNTFEKDFHHGVMYDLASAYMESEDGRKLKEALLQDRSPFPTLQARECMKGTRERLLERIYAELFDLEGTNLIWINGYPGVGKSAVASRIMSMPKLLAFYFRFERGNNAATAQILWRSIAYKLACLFPSIRKGIQASLRNQLLNPASPDVEGLFRSLIKEPLMRSASSIPEDRPIVIVIDGVDEAYDPDPETDGQTELLNTLKQWSDLPKRFKLIFTSRVEDHITRVLSSTQHIALTIPSGSSADRDANDDIQKYLEKLLLDYSRTTWFSTAVSILKEGAAGVFQWAKTAVSLIATSDDDPRELLELISGQFPGLNGEKSLFHLYSTLLETRFKHLKYVRELEAKCQTRGDSTARKILLLQKSKLEALRPVLAAIGALKEPLRGTDKQCAEILGVDVNHVSHVRKALSSVLLSDALFFNHKSFIDFLHSPLSCPPEFVLDDSIDSKAQLQMKLSGNCLDVMLTDQLRFNRCNIATSAKRNSDDLLEKAIPSHLSYSCRFWADHLDTVPFDSTLGAKVEAMLRGKLLFWIEVMSVLNQVNRVITALRQILSWSKNQPMHSTQSQDFTAFLYDALRFVIAFIEPITQSAPHIYISALPFSPELSLIAEQWLPKFPKTLMLTMGRPTSWSPFVFSSNIPGGEKSSFIGSLSFSPDQKSFVAAASDSTAFSVYDSEMGTLLSGPFSHNGSQVKAVGYSPGGTRIVAAYPCGEVAIWNLTTGKICSSSSISFPGQAPLKSSILTINYCDSGRKILARTSLQYSEGSPVEAVTLFDTVDLSAPQELLFQAISKDSSDKRVSFLLAFSPWSSYVTSARSNSKGAPITLWDITKPGTSTEIPQPDNLRAISISDDGKFFVTQAKSGIIRIWSMETRYTVKEFTDRSGKPLADGFAMAYSPATGLLALLFTDAIVIWDVPTDTRAKKIFDWPASNVRFRTLSFSGDGTRLLIGLKDKAVVRMLDFGPYLNQKESLADMNHFPTRSNVEEKGGAFRPWLPAGWSLSLDPKNPSSRVALYDDKNVSRRSWSLPGEPKSLKHPPWDYSPPYLELCETLGPVDSLKSGSCGEMVSPSGKVTIAFDSTSSGVFIKQEDSQRGSIKTSFIPCGEFLTRNESWAISPDERFFAYQHRDSTIRVHDVSTGQLISGPWYSEEKIGLHFSSRGTELITTDQDVSRVWDISDLYGESNIGFATQCFGDGSHIDADGWVKRESGELLFWVPVEHRRALYRPRNLLVTVTGLDGRKEYGTQLDLKDFDMCNGTRWDECVGAKRGWSRK
ncbi:hypothetical protein NP233_g10706 [Leucocoprinus birnbaumii]|uniref:NACHT domain-containing protein n=1 Tax=Leucocoprinus birnbaumii TaxID=56174 RepID=A0AAD5YRN1_9AGAR|nr:hypothetical protein NP233_g10706 [Leucocoprinus birnbaumii]